MMADEPEPSNDVVSVWLRRIAPVVDVISKLGLTTVLILIIGLGVGWATGYLPLKPFDDLSTEHQKLERAIGDAQDRQKVEIGRTTEMLDRLTALISRMDRRAQLIDCARLNDVDLRKRCLE